MDFATVFRNAVREAGLERRLEAPAAITDLPGVSAAVGSLCAAGVTVALDEFQICHRGPLSGFPSLLQAQVDKLQNRDPVGGLILLGSVQTEMEALLDDRQAPLCGSSRSNTPCSSASAHAVHGTSFPIRSSARGSA